MGNCQYKTLSYTTLIDMKETTGILPQRHRGFYGDSSIIFNSGLPLYNQEIMSFKAGDRLDKGQIKAGNRQRIKEYTYPDKYGFTRP